MSHGPRPLGGETSTAAWLNDLAQRPPSAQTPHLRIFKSTVFIRDHERSIHFYVEQLGFNVVADARFEFGGRWVAVAPPDGSAVLALVAPRRGTENYRLIGRNTQIAFIAEDINATFELWRSRGVRFHHLPQQSLFGTTFAGFSDVDGNSFELLGSDEMTRDIEAQRRAHAEKLELERRAAQELEIAKQVQARLFPQTLPPIGTLDYAGVCVQARQVGGDYYDFLALGRDRLGLLIGDISGKGIAAALLMANLQANLRSQFALASEHLASLLKSVNQLFFENTTDSAYATVFCAEYEDAAQRLHYANCGHLPGLLLRANGEVEHLHSTGMVLGLFPEWSSEAVDCRLKLGNILALYTDGVTESSNDKGEEFGESRLIDVIERHRRQSAPEIVAAVVDEVQRFSAGQQQHDDITVIIAKCRKPSARKLSASATSR